MPDIMINDCNLFYEEHGTGQHTVLFLHGLYFNCRQFHQQIVALRDRYRCVAVDLRGQGQSSAPPRDYDPEAIARDIIQFIDVRRYGDCHVVGHSIGGIVAMHVVIQRPELVKSLALIGTTAGESPVTSKRKLKRQALRIKLFGMRFVIPTIMRTLFSPAYLADSVHAEQIAHWEQEIARINRHHIARVLAGLQARSPLYDDLYKIQKPTLIIAGEQDQAISRHATHRLNNGIAGAHLVMVPDAGHAVNLEKPAVVSKVLIEFFTRFKS